MPKIKKNKREKAEIKKSEKKQKNNNKKA